MVILVTGLGCCFDGDTSDWFGLLFGWWLILVCRMVLVNNVRMLILVCRMVLCRMCLLTCSLRVRLKMFAIVFFVREFYFGYECWFSVVRYLDSRVGVLSSHFGRGLSLLLNPNKNRGGGHTSFHWTPIRTEEGDTPAFRIYVYIYKINKVKNLAYTM